MFRTSPVVAEDEWHLDLQVEGHIAVLTLNRPDKLNAWSWESTRQLGACADQIRFDERVRAVVLRGEGRAFCAGIDLGMPEDRVTGRSPAEKARNYYEGIRWAHERFKVFAELPQPVVAAVQGYCLGFGFELVLMSDIRVAAEDAVFALPEAQVGVGIDAGGDLRLAHEAGAGWAKLLAFTGRRLDARTAERIGVSAAGAQWMRSGLSPTSNNISAAVPEATVRLQQFGRAVGRQRFQVSVVLLDLGIQQQPAPSD